MLRNLTKGSFIQVRGTIRNYELPGADGKPVRQVTEIVVTGFARLDRATRQPLAKGGGGLRPPLTPSNEESSS